jgi:hypothetical protein
VWRTAPNAGFEHGGAFAVAFDAVVETCGFNMGEIAFPPAAIVALSNRIKRRRGPDNVRSCPLWSLQPSSMRSVFLRKTFFRNTAYDGLKSRNCRRASLLSDQNSQQDSHPWSQRLPPEVVELDVREGTRTRSEARLGAIALPGRRDARSGGGIDCPAAFIHDAVGRH